MTFAAAVGAKTKLQISQVFCNNNPDWSYLQSVRGSRWASHVDRDYTITSIDRFLEVPLLAKSRLVWQTMAPLEYRRDVLVATYQINKSWGANQSPSQLVHHLRNAVWVPQGQDRFVRPSDAVRELLPEGFPFDAGWPWLTSIEFGESALQKSDELQEKEAAAKALGFADSNSLERATRFTALPLEIQERILAEQERQNSRNLPERESGNPERRAERVRDQSQLAPRRQSEKRQRSVSVGLDAIKEKAAEYLRQQYGDVDTEMICQICKGPLPFKLDDGKPYFESVELLPELKKHYYQNYLALCPNHAAMFQYANGSSGDLRNMVTEMAGNEITVVLAQNLLSIYFTQNHRDDLGEVMKVDSSGGDNADELQTSALEIEPEDVR